MQVFREYSETLLMIFLRIQAFYNNFEELLKMIKWKDSKKQK